MNDNLILEDAIVLPDLNREQNQIELLRQLSCEEIAYWLHLIFFSFSAPAPTLEDINRIVLLYQDSVGRNPMEMKVELKKVCNLEEILRNCHVVIHSVRSPLPPFHSKHVKTAIDAFLNTTDDGSMSNLARETNSVSCCSDNHVSCPLPLNCLICTKETVSSPVVLLLATDPYLCLFLLPKAFQLAFFRIIIRLFTNEDDVAYRQYYEYGIEDDLLDQTLLHEPVVERFDSCLEELNRGSVKHEQKISHHRSSMETKTSLKQSSICSVDDICSICSDGGKFYGWGPRSVAEDNEFPLNSPPDRSPFPETINLHTDGFSHASEKSWQKRRLIVPDSSNDFRKSALYCVVRFRCAPVWNNFLSDMVETTDPQDAAVDCLANLVECVMSSFSMSYGENLDHLVGPICRLLGLLCIAGVEPRVVKRILFLISEKDLEKEERNSTPIKNALKLYLIRSLETAAASEEITTCDESDFPASSPSEFFVYNGEGGIDLSAMTELNVAPFSEAFGFSVSFRLDLSSLSTNPSLFAFFLGEECRFSAHFQPLGTHQFLLVVKVHQSETTPRIIPVTTHKFSTGRWYHIAIQHGKRVATNNHDSALTPEKVLEIYVDGISVLTENVAYPFGWFEGENDLEPLIELGRNMLGQSGALRLFNKKVCASTIRALHMFEFGMLKTNKKHHPSEAKRGSSSKKTFFTPQHLLNEFLSDAQFMVWAPCYTYGNMIPEHARGWHGSFPKFSISSWAKTRIKDSVLSIGGIQVLLPLFHTLVPANVNEHHRRGLAGLLPCLLCLLSSVLWNHDDHTIAMLKFKGVSIVERCIVDCDQYLGLNVLKRSTKLSTDTVNSVLALYASTSCNSTLQFEILSRLLLNVSLWLGNSQAGDVLSSAYLPLFSFVARSLPNESLLQAINLTDIMIFVPNLIQMSNMDKGTGDGAKWLSESKLCNSTVVFLTFHDLRHLAEVIFMMVTATCASIHLPCCLLHYLSYILNTKTEEYNFRNFALASASLVCLSLIGKRRQEDKKTSDYSKDLVDWIIIGVEYSWDDLVDSVYIRCIHAYWRCTADSGIIAVLFQALRGKTCAELSYNAIMALFIDCERDKRENELFLLDLPIENALETSPVCGFTLLMMKTTPLPSVFKCCGFGSTEVVEHILDLVRNFPDTLLHRFLRDFWEMLEEPVKYSEKIWKSRKCHKNLFFLVSDAISDCIETSMASEGDNENLSYRILVAESRMEVALKIYGKLLGECVRGGGEEACTLIEFAASLQQLSKDGERVFTCILCYLFRNLREEGLIHSEEKREEATTLGCNAELIIKSILTNGANSSDFVDANIRWKCLRHLVALAAGAVAANGFGIDVLILGHRFRKCNGIQFDEGTPLSLSVSADNKGSFLHETVALTTQVLLVTDNFFAVHSSKLSVEVSTALGLTGCFESPLGFSQRPPISSMIRLSLLLLIVLDPYNDMFDLNLLRLSFFLRWCSVASSQSRDKQDQSLSKILVSSVFFLYIASQKCFAVLQEGRAVLSQSDHRQVILLNGDRIRGIISEMFKGFNELLMAYLPKAAYDSMKAMFQNGTTRMKKHAILQLIPRRYPSVVNTEDSIFSFLYEASVWSRTYCSFHTAPGVHPRFIDDLAMETSFIISEFRQSTSERNPDIFGEGKGRQLHLISSFREKVSLTNEKLLEQLVCFIKELKVRPTCLSNDDVLLRDQVLNFWNDTTNCWRSKTALHWKWSDWDSTFGRILFIQNKNFDAHLNCAYEPLGKRIRQQNLSKRISMGLIKRATMAFHSEVVQPAPNSILIEANRSPEEKSSYPPDYTTTKHQQLDDVDNLTSNNEDIKKMALKKFGIEAQEEEETLWKATSTTKINLGKQHVGEFLVTNKGIYFQEINSKAKEAMAKNKDHICDNVPGYKWKISLVLDLHRRKYLLQDCGLVIIFKDNSTAFFSFESKKARDIVYDILKKTCKSRLLWSEGAENGKWISRLQTVTELWRKRRMSNFDYLSYLNFFAGRSYFDLSQYPVMPWVLTDWTSKTLDLNNYQVFRDLSKPVGTLNPDRLSAILERYNDQHSFEDGQSFMYGSLYSSPAIVLYFLLRTEPFTTLAIELQSGKFDRPDRLFSSMYQAWTSSLQSTSDFKELIPELFTSPDIFQNCNRFNFGKTQEGKVVDHVDLPPWANGCPHKFIKLHRLALESEYVGNNLHHWIDLIFGYKQRGKAAVKSNNVFHFLCYNGYDVEAISDPYEKDAAKSFIENFGCIPKQLFPSPHPSRSNKEESFSPIYLELLPKQSFCCYIPPAQYGGHILAPAKGSVLNTTFVKDTLVVVYSDLHVGSYRVLNLADSFVAYQESLQKLRCNLIDQDSLPVSYPHLLVAIAWGGSNQELTSCTLQQFATKNFPKHLPTAGMRAVRKSLSKAFLFKSTSSISGSSTESVFLVRCNYFDRTISLHLTEAPQREHKCNWLHRGPITCIAVGENGLVVTGGQDATCRVYILDHPEMVMALLDSTIPNGLSSSLESDQIQRLACVQVLWGHKSSVQSICVSSLLDIVVSGGIDGTVCIHKALSGEFIRFIDLFSCQEATAPLATRRRGIRRIAVCKWGLLVIHSEDGMLHKGTLNGAILLSVDSRDLLNALEISQEGEVVVSGGQIGHFLVRNLGDLTVVYTLDLSMNGPIEYTSFSQMNSSFTKCCICVGSKNGAIVLVYPEVID